MDPASASQAGPREQGARCPICGNAVLLGDSIHRCEDCGGIHHAACWRGACGSYECAPGRRQVDPADRIARITVDDLQQTAPLPPSTPRFQPGAMPIQPAPRKTNRLAIAAFIFGLAGIPLFGIVTGMVAVVLACLAMGSIYQKSSKGMVWASSGLVLGLGDVGLWIFIIMHFLGGPHTISPMRISDLKFDPAELQHVRPAMQRAMRANVVINLGNWATGSGVILQIENGRATILTNRHVIDPGFSESDDATPHTPSDLEVVMLSQSAVPGHVEWIAPNGIDAAIVTAACRSNDANATNTDPKPDMDIGDEIFAIGNPYALDWTLSRGTISQVRTRSYGLTDVRIIQTETAINPGNSGGGLYDHDGRLIGINTWTNDKSVSEGLSFAIAFESIRKLMPAEYLPPQE